MITLILIILLITYISYKLNIFTKLKNKLQVGGGSNVHAPVTYSEVPVSGAVDEILKRKVQPGIPYINHLRPLDTTGLCRQGPAPPGKDKEMMCIPPDQPLYERIDKDLPYMFDKPAFVNPDNGASHYMDWRYPQQPIPVEFAVDPHGYCKKNPSLYPCNVRAVKYDIDDRK